MTIVYLVTSGEYSDYRVDGVYSTKELAEKAKIALGDVDIETYVLDEFADHLNQGLSLWQVEISKCDNGESRTWKTSRPTTWIGFKSLNLAIWAKDEQHALKIASEKRAIYLATGELR
jgi:hypothetical protein